MAARAKTKALSRQERALSWRRDQVLECAERVFSEKGFHEATMQEIAEEAEYATGTLYTLFENTGAVARGARMSSFFVPASGWQP